MGFHDYWINLISKYVETVSFLVKVNGRLLKPFRPTKGLRQGDPISPYLFLICAEGLTSLLKFEGTQYLSEGIKMRIHTPWISHWLFADDCIVFTQASKKGAERLQEVLEAYNKGLGQLVNKEKSAIFFVKRRKKRWRELWK